MIEQGLTGGAFAIAAALGAILGRAYCVGQESFEDGPSPVRVRTSLIVVVGAFVGLGVAWHGASLLELATLGLVVVALAACAVCDLQIGLAPDLFTLVPLGALVISSCLQRNYGPTSSAVITALPFAIVAVISKGLGIGWGDVKLVALTGALLGAGQATLALIVASAAALALSRLGHERARPIAFAPFIIAGVALMLVLSPRS